MRSSRREFCRNAALAVAATSLPFLPSPVRASTISLGSARVSSFSDGTMVIPSSMLFETEDNPEIAAKMAASGMGEGSAARPLNITYVEKDDRRILFDAGSGVNFLPGLGELPAALDEAGVDITEITDVVFTHAHPDHIWGVLDDFDDLAMPDATFHMARPEWDFWYSDEALAVMPAGRENFAVGAKSRMEAMEDQISLFGFGDEILPGVEAVDSVGHTPGHAAFALHDGGQSLMILGDALTHPLISFEHPGFRNLSDMDSDAAVASRKALLDRMHTDAMQLIGYHLPQPGFGRVEKTADAWRYNADV
ncbi:MAG: MBL fold metallo-hydrolase [Candidatus Puniceispirillales bacterium]